MRALAASLAVFVACGAARAEPPALVDWPQAPVAPAVPLTDAEKERIKSEGRTLPTPELLQPTLDPALPAYAPPKAKLTGHFTAAASDVLPGLAHAWIAAFQKLHPDVTIELKPPYAGSLGAKELVDGKIDLVFVSRELKPDDISAFAAKYGYPPLSVPVSGGTYRHYGFLDAVGFFVSRDNPLDTLSFAQLDRIYSATHHRGGTAAVTWGDLGLTGEWADKPIHAYGIKPWNGFEEFVRQRVLSTEGKRGEWREGIGTADVVFPMAGKVADDRYGIAYSGLAYIDRPVKMLALRAEPNGPAVGPSYEAVASATYPLTRLTFLNLNKAPAKPLDPALAAFLQFVRSRDGQRLVLEQAIYLPLRESQRAASQPLLDK